MEDVFRGARQSSSSSASEAAATSNNGIVVERSCREIARVFMVEGGELMDGLKSVFPLMVCLSFFPKTPLQKKGRATNPELETERQNPLLEFHSPSHSVIINFDTPRARFFEWRAFSMQQLYNFQNRYFSPTNLLCPILTQDL